MEAERPAFAYEVVLLDAPEIVDPRECLLQSAEALARQAWNTSGGRPGEIPPFLVIEEEGEVSAVLYRSLMAIDSQYFLEVVVPETLVSLEPDSVALVGLPLPMSPKGAAAGLTIFGIDRVTPGSGVTLTAWVVGTENSDVEDETYRWFESRVLPIVAEALER